MAVGFLTCTTCNKSLYLQVPVGPHQAHLALSAPGPAWTGLVTGDLAENITQHNNHVMLASQ